MAWTRRGFKGINAEELSSTVQKGEGHYIEETGMELTAVNKLTYPGEVKFNLMSGVSFNSGWTAGSSFKSINVSKWFRDSGSTTT